MTIHNLANSLISSFAQKDQPQSPLFSWEPAPRTLNSQDVVVDVYDVPKKALQNKQLLLSIDMKTKVVQHVLGIIFNIF